MSTPTETTRIAAGAASPAGGVRVSAAGGAFRVMTLRSSAWAARVALVPDRALLLAGDRVRIEVAVEAGTRLELVETAGTVAYDMRGGGAAWDVDVTVADGATLVWEGLPLVVAAGANVSRSTTVALRGDAAFRQRETVVLGRYGEPPGSLSAVTRITRDAHPLLVEELDGRHLAPYRVLDSVLRFGPDDSTDVVPSGGVRLVLESGDVVWRSLTGQAHESASALEPVWRAVTGGTDPERTVRWTGATC
jgi:urease accessory protein